LALTATVEQLLTRLLDGDVNALPRLISLIEKGDPSVPELLERIRPRTGHAQRVGVTGPPGAGKSTLVEALTGQFRKQGMTVGILGVDPSSPFTGGAILGDRVRMRDHYLDPGVFIRSMATRGAPGGLSAVASRALKVLDAAGLDVILLETAGVGQTELAVMDAVDTVVVVVVPEAGDAIQTMKAGLLEIADIFVVNKADRPGARRMAADLETNVHLGTHNDWWTPPVLLAEAYRGVGVPEVAQAIRRHLDVLVETDHLDNLRREQRRRELQRAIREEILTRVREAANEDGKVGALLHRVEMGDLDPDIAAGALLADESLLREWLLSPGRRS
jgi:LAO/AO transport system kinase